MNWSIHTLHQFCLPLWQQCPSLCDMCLDNTLNAQLPRPACSHALPHWEGYCSTPTHRPHTTSHQHCLIHSGTQYMYVLYLGRPREDISSMPPSPPKAKGCQGENMVILNEDFTPRIPSQPSGIEFPGIVYTYHDIDSWGNVQMEVCSATAWIQWWTYRRQSIPKLVTRNKTVTYLNTL